MASIPILAGLNHPVIIGFFENAIPRCPSFAHRFFMLTNQRPPFRHLAHITARIPPPAFIELCRLHADEFKKGQVIPVHGMHPFTNESITEIKVDHVFSSLARPMILSFPGTRPPDYSNLSIVAAESYCRVLLKQNEDIYHEATIQLLFKCMNEMWSDHLPASLRPFLCSFREVPASPTLGFLQIIEGCKDLEVIERSGFDGITKEKTENFIRTTCGWCLGAYVLGLSDRHRENTLVRLSDGSAIPIDFGFMLGNTAPSINTYMITISSQMYNYLLQNEAWSSFTTMFLAGFMCIRLHADLFLTLAGHLFNGHRDPVFVRRFIANRLLKQHENHVQALNRIVKRLRHAPVCSDTKFKIENHQKNKTFLAMHGGNFMVRLVIKRAVEARPEIKTEGRFHKFHVPLILAPPESML